MTFVGIDIGGTTTRLAHTQNLQRPMLTGKKVFPTANDFESNYRIIRNFINNQGHIKGIGISIPGELAQDKSRVLSARNVPGYVDEPLPVLLSEEYNCTVRMDNDAVVAAIGEALYGSSEKSDFIFIIWGTGIGGASVVYQGDVPTSTKLNWSEYLQSWENRCGGNSLQKNFGKQVEQLNDIEWKRVMDAFSDELLLFKDKLKPKRIIFGGGITIRQTERLKNMATQLQERFASKMPILEISSLGEDAGIYGALGLLKEDQ